VKITCETFARKFVQVTCESSTRHTCKLNKESCRLKVAFRGRYCVVKVDLTTTTMFSLWSWNSGR